MKRARRSAIALGLVLAVSGWPAHLRGQTREVDAGRSSLKIRVFKSGLFSAFAHNHEIEAPLDEGAVELSGTPRVTLRFDARKLHVLDPELAADKRAEIQKTMLGPEVLDSARFAEITFQSTAVQNAGANQWKLTGNLTLHGKTRSVLVDVALKDGHYQGAATLKQRSFGIEPISIAGGTVKVKDEVKIEFDIVLKP